MKTALVIASTIGLLVACGGTQSASKTSSSPSTVAKAATTPTPQAARNIFHVGDKVEIKSSDGSTDIAVVVNSFKVFRSPDSYFQPKLGQFVLVDVSVSNLGDKPYTFSFLNLELRDSTGQGYGSTYVPGTPTQPQGEVAPQDIVRGVAAYDVPKDQSFRFYVKGAIFASGQAIFDLGQPQ